MTAWRRWASGRASSPPGGGLSLGEAATLGLLQGFTELLPVSSSAHITLIPWLCGWRYAALDAELRKSFEVALHAGAGAALAIDMRGDLGEAARRLDRRRASVIVLSLAPPALAGYTLERTIERRLGGPGSIAAGLILGAVAMALADLRPTRGGRRREQEAGPGDGLAIGLAQALALIPGVSRAGATLTAGRARGFARGDAHTLSWHAGLPVILGASALRARRMWRDGPPADGGRALAVGAGSAFLATTASVGVLRGTRLGGRGLLPYCAYRCVLAAITIVRMRGRAA
jgi:undecaprenyl-diphosphatase